MALQAKRPFYPGDITAALDELPGRRMLVTTPVHLKTLLADGVRLFATAIPLAILLRGSEAWAGWSQEGIYVFSIVVMAGLTFAYTTVGGIRAVIWTDVVQMVIYLGAAVAAGVLLSGMIPGGWEAAARLGVPPAGCVAFEDAPTGIAAAAAAGMHTVALTTSFAAGELTRHDPAPDQAVADFEE